MSYDAMVGIGMAACRAWRGVGGSMKNSTLGFEFTGKEHHSFFVNHTFWGASGRVEFDPSTYARVGKSVYYLVSNILPVETSLSSTEGQSSEGASETEGARSFPEDARFFRGVRRFYFDYEQEQFIPWSEQSSGFGDGNFIFSDGGDKPPPDLPPVTVDPHYIDPFARGFGLAMCAISMVTSIAFFVVVIIHRNHRVVLASQPPFIILLCSGTLLMASSGIPNAIDDSVASAQGCTIACMSKMWLLSIGFTLTFSALFSKLWRINKVRLACETSV
jgi:hypothetical protein